MFVKHKDAELLEFRAVVFLSARLKKTVLWLGFLALRLGYYTVNWFQPHLFHVHSNGILNRNPTDDYQEDSVSKEYKELHTPKQNKTIKIN